MTRGGRMDRPLMLNVLQSLKGSRIAAIGISVGVLLGCIFAFLFLHSLFLSDNSVATATGVPLSVATSRMVLEDATSAFEEKPTEPSSLKEEAVIHERLLKANHGDYGKSDPHPVLHKPPGKIIPHD